MKKFSELEYKRPDLEEYTKAMNAGLDRAEAAGSYEEARAIFFELEDLSNRVNDMFTIASIRNTMNKADEFYDAEMQFVDSETPKLMPLFKRQSEVMLNSKFRADFEKEFGEMITMHDLKTLPLKNEALIPLQIKENELTTEYSKTAATCVCDFRGEKCNFYGLLKHMQSTDRATRKEAFEAWAGLYESVSEKLEDIYDQLVHNRAEQAKILGFDFYGDVCYLDSGHFDYTKEDVAAFRKQVVETIVPAAAELFEEQRKRLGLDELYFYDEALVFADGNANPIGTKDELVAKAQKMYSELSPETKEFFDFMVKYDLFDLETRPNKHLGGYMTILNGEKAPFIFSNFNGTSADVDVLTHEAGHAFQGYTGSRCIPVSSLSMSTSDIDEIHSMTMEMLTYPWMDLFFGDKVDKYRYLHLTDTIKVIPYLCAVDEYQHRVYEKPEMTSMERRAVWKHIEEVYLPWRKYDGNAFMETGAFWMQKQHIFLYPFYYVDYALAQVSAYQLFNKYNEDKKEGWEAYLTLCKNGGTMSYLKLLEASGIKSPFAEGTVKEALDGILKIVDQFRKAL